jgi:hypothetical protein
MKNPFRRLLHREPEPESVDVQHELEDELGHEDESRRFQEHRADQAEFELGRGRDSFTDKTR